MPLEVRSIRADELKPMLEVVELAFGDEHPEEEFKQFARVAEPDRFLVATEEDDIVGGAGAFSFELTVPGNVVNAAGVTVVGVLPSHRRRGALTAMMRFQLADVHRRKEPLAILWASESTIYQRFGYGMATVVSTIDIERERTAFNNDLGPAGRTRLLSPEAALLVIPEVYDRVRLATPGMYARSQDWWEAHSMLDLESNRRGSGPLFRAVWENDDGEAEAYALYRIHSEWSDEGFPSGKLFVREALATSFVATREMWRFIFGVDLVARVTSWCRPPDDPLWHMLAEPRRLRATRHDGLWLRVVDVRAALEARRYAADGAVTFELRDDFCPWNTGVHRLECKEGEGRVSEAPGGPALTVSAADLGAVYLGGTSLTGLARAGRVIEHDAGAAARTDTMLKADRAPYCPEIF